MFLKAAKANMELLKYFIFKFQLFSLFFTSFILIWTTVPEQTLQLKKKNNQKPKTPKQNPQPPSKHTKKPTNKQ